MKYFTESSVCVSYMGGGKTPGGANAAPRQIHPWAQDTLGTL